MIRQMDIMKSTARDCSLQKRSFLFYIFCLSNPQLMNGLIIVFVSREGWSTTVTVIETNYKASNLISISFNESSNFGSGYTTESQNFL